MHHWVMAVGFAPTPPPRHFPWVKDEPRLHQRWRCRQLAGRVFSLHSTSRMCQRMHVLLRPLSGFLVSAGMGKLLANACNCSQPQLIPAYTSHVVHVATSLFSQTSSCWKQFGKMPGLTHGPSTTPPCTRATPMWVSAGLGGLDGCRSGRGWETPPPRISSSIPTHLLPSFNPSIHGGGGIEELNRT